MENFTNDRPIYLQLIDIFKDKILQGEWKMEEKVPSVRDLALTYSVNPNTVQRALSIMEEEGLLRSERTAGRFVNSKKDDIDMLKEQRLEEATIAFIETMKALGVNKKKGITFLEKKWEE